jgi:hypothetical protein
MDDNDEVLSLGLELIDPKKWRKTNTLSPHMCGIVITLHLSSSVFFLHFNLFLTNQIQLILAKVLLWWSTTFCRIFVPFWKFNMTAKIIVLEFLTWHFFKWKLMMHRCVIMNQEVEHLVLEIYLLEVTWMTMMKCSPLVWN